MDVGKQNMTNGRNKVYCEKSAEAIVVVGYEPRQERGGLTRQRRAEL